MAVLLTHDGRKHGGRGWASVVIVKRAGILIVQVKQALYKDSSYCYLQDLRANPME